jgi:hypothetical protein
MYNGTYTIQNKETGEHRTFSIKTQKDDSRFAPGKRILALLTGCDNNSDYTGFGFVDDEQVHLWRSKQTVAFLHYSRMIQAAHKAIQAASVDNDGVADAEFDYFDRHYTVKSARRCMRCNRKLTTPESISRGLGEDCASKMGR